MTAFNRFRDATISIILLLIPFLFLNSNLKNPSRSNALDRFVLQLSAPIQYVATESAHGVSRFLEQYIWLVEVQKENERLARQNARLKRDIELSLSKFHEAQELRDMLRLRNESPLELLSAKVIARDINSFFRVVRLRLDRGDQDGVKSGMPVISPAGLVGQVQRSSGAYSDVLLAVDPRSAIDVVVDKSGARGMLRGTGESDRYLCRIQYLDRADQVRVGDRVVSSGYGKRFPAGLPIGTISKVVRKKFGLHQEAEVTPFVNLSALNHVFVVGGSRQTEVNEAK